MAASGFDVTGAPLDRDALAIGLGVATHPLDGVVLDVRYDGVLARGAQDHSFSATLSARF